MLRVENVMMRSPAAVAVGETSHEAVERMRERGLHCIPAVCGDYLVGLVYEDGLPEDDRPVTPWIRPSGVTLTAQEEVGAALRKAQPASGSEAPCAVVDRHGRLVGVTSAADLRCAMRSDELTRFLE